MPPFIKDHILLCEKYYQNQTRESEYKLCTCGYDRFIQASLYKIQGLFKDFLKTFLLFSRSDLHNKILLQICWTALLKILVLENIYKIVVPLFGAAYAAPNKDTTILY